MWPPRRSECDDAISPANGGGRVNKRRGTVYFVEMTNPYVECDLPPRRATSPPNPDSIEYATVNQLTTHDQNALLVGVKTFRQSRQTIGFEQMPSRLG